MNKTTEDAIEQTALAWLVELGFELAQGPDLALDGPAPGGAHGQPLVD